jgi:hypothetical protein
VRAPASFRLGQRFKAVAEGETDAFHDRPRQHVPVALVADAGENAADRRIIVRRALAAEIGQEDDARRSQKRLAQRPGQLRRIGPVIFSYQLSESVADRMTPIWCQVPGSAWQKACTALSAFGR